MLNSDGIIAKTLRPGSRIRPYNRLLCSLGSAITLILVYWVTPRENEVAQWEWHGALVVVRGAIWVVALAMGCLSFRLISISDFPGFTVLGIGRNGGEMSDQLITSGIFGEMWNLQVLAGFLLLWARDLTRTGIDLIKRTRPYA